ncbi:hypothetical protein ZIOFF_040537 [Zingiber officinale]|uniref:CASP-like protein n=1 Tax=Zingiber officinale TaxID=94328 RepID=A0A8J5GHP8_ZINOF|nr:hypothetical protein ZIOFF_040537 [Zingiber officinale]
MPPEKQAAQVILPGYANSGSQNTTSALGDLARNFKTVGFASSYLVASMGLQALWSLGLACLDIYAIKVKRDLHNHLLVSLFVVGDWVTGTLSLAAACSSAGVTVLFVRDTDFCKSFPQLSCGKLQVSTAMAFITWMFVSASALVMSWILTSS